MFEDIDKANTEITRLQAVETKFTESQTQLTSLGTEKDTLIKDNTNLQSIITKANEGVEVLTKSITEKDASIEALTAKITESDTLLRTLEGSNVPKEQFDTLKTDYTSNLIQGMKTRYGLADPLFENKSIDQLKAMDESLTATQSGNTNVAGDQRGNGLNSGGGNSNGAGGTKTNLEAATDILAGLKK